MFILYRVTNSVNGKSYVGLTKKGLKARWKQHLRHAYQYHTTSKLYNSMRKYGQDAFTVETLVDHLTQEEALEGEKLLVEFFDTFNDGLNSTMGGDHLISSEWQRQNQLKRVKEGTHPFIGGGIQAKSSKRRWDEGTNPLRDFNEKRLREGTHNLLGDKNPTRIRAKLGKHHNQKPAWLNTKANPAVWKIADEIYNKWLETGWSYRNLQKHFDTDTHLGSMVSKFKKGWIPVEDLLWKEWVT